MKGNGRKWKLLCAGLAAAGVLAGMPGAQVPVAEAMYSTVDAAHHWYKTPNEQQKLFLLAIKDNDYATAKDMIDSGVDVNGVYRDFYSDGTTALQMAIRENNRNIMQLLLEQGAQVTGFTDFDGENVDYLVYALQQHREDLELVKYLHAWGADINGKTTNVGNALTFIVWNGYGENSVYEIARYLLEQGIDSEVKDRDGDTPFIDAVKRKQYSVIQLLAEKGANVNARDYHGKNAAELALQWQDLNLYKFVKGIMNRGNQPSNYTPPAGTAISMDNTKSNRTSSAAQSHAGRGATATKFSEVFVKYNDASNAIYNELTKSLKVDMTKPEQKKAALSKEADAIKELRKLNEKMAKEDPLKGLKGYSVGEREKFTDAFDGIREKNEAMIAYMEYCVAHPDDAQEDQLTALTQAVLTAHETQKQRVDDVLALIKN